MSEIQNRAALVLANPHAFAAQHAPAAVKSYQRVAGIQRQICIDFIKTPAAQFKMLNTGYSLQFAISILNTLCTIKLVVA